MAQPIIKKDIEARVQFSNTGFNETLNNTDIPISWQTLAGYKNTDSGFNDAFYGSVFIGPGAYSPQIVIGSGNGNNKQKVLVRRYITGNNSFTPWTELFTTHGGTINGNLTIKKDTQPSLYLYNNTSTAQAILQELDSETFQILNYYDGNNYNGIYITKHTNTLKNQLRFVSKTDGTSNVYDILHGGNYSSYALPLSGGTLTGDLYLLTGDNDRYIWFDYSQSASTMGASWRIGYQGTGSNDSNHFVIQRTGSATGGSETWSDIMQCWMNTAQVDFFANTYAKKDSGSVTIGCIRTDNSNQISLMIGSGGANKGLYDANLDAWLCFTDGTDYWFATSAKYNNVYLGSSNVYVNTAGVLYGAAWNDYAEYRKTALALPGEVVAENGDGTLSITTERLQPGCVVVSDTFGFSIGQTDDCQTPIAVSGRVLAYPAEDRYSYKPGDAVCSAPNGRISKMTRREIIMYPERIIGTVSEIPEYERWGEGNVLVDGRIWISIR